MLLTETVGIGGLKAPIPLCLMCISQCDSDNMKDCICFIFSSLKGRQVTLYFFSPSKIFLLLVLEEWPHVWNNTSSDPKVFQCLPGVLLHCFVDMNDQFKVTRAVVTPEATPTISWCSLPSGALQGSGLKSWRRHTGWRP